MRWSEFIACRTRKISALFGAAVLAFALVLITAEGAFRAFLFCRARLAAPAGNFELYAMGESSMNGMPFHVPPAYIVAELFSHRIAGRPVRVINLAFSGNSVYPQAIKTIRALKYRRSDGPAALLIYSGHNENMQAGPAPSLAARCGEAFKRRILIHSLLLSEIVQRLENRCHFYGVRDLDHYKFYLRAVIEAAREARVVPVIATLASNISGVEPGGDGTAAGMAEALRLEMGGDCRGAQARYREMLAVPHPGADASSSAYPAYRLGRCLLALGRPDEAKGYFLSALENDPSQLRAKPSQNAAIRRLAGEYGIALVDAEKLFAAHSGAGLPGGDLMVDVMHPGMAGYLLLSRAFAGSLAAAFGERLRNDIRDPAALPLAPDMRAVYGHLAYTYAGLSLLWFSRPGLPIPDRLALAEKDFSAALRLSGGNTAAEIGFRIARISRRNGWMIPEELDGWFRRNQAGLEGLRPFSAEELAQAEAMLRRWEKPGPAVGGGGSKCVELNKAGMTFAIRPV